MQHRGRLGRSADIGTVLWKSKDMSLEFLSPESAKQLTLFNALLISQVVDQVDPLRDRVLRWRWAKQTTLKPRNYFSLF